MSDTQTPPRFIWPPRPLDESAPALDVAAGAASASASTQGPQAPSPRLLPAKQGAEKPSPDRGTTAYRPPAGWRGVIREIERIWLGLERPPLAERLAAAGWVADPPDAYCARCGTTVGPYEADAGGCSACRGRRLPWERMIRLGEYTGELRETIHEVKFGRWRRLGHDLGRLLGRSLAAAMETAPIDPAQAMIVPVPASFWRRMERGIDHTRVLARGVRQETGCRILPLLERRHRPSQRSVPASQRAANVAGSIRVRRPLDLSGWTIIVLDDVTTTRATLTASCRAVARCHKLLRDNVQRRPPRIWTAVIGVTPRPGRRLG